MGNCIDLFLPCPSESTIVLTLYALSVKIMDTRFFLCSFLGHLICFHLWFIYFLLRHVTYINNGTETRTQILCLTTTNFQLPPFSQSQRIFTVMFLEGLHPLGLEVRLSPEVWAGTEDEEGGLCRTEPCPPQVLSNSALVPNLQSPLAKPKLWKELDPLSISLTPT